MSLAAVLAVVAAMAVTVVILVVGSVGTRVARTTDDFLAASRSVGSRANAAAVSGQYLSAAAFLGVAGVVLAHGVDGLWYPIGFVAGFLALLLFVAAPLRRSGAYTVPDFAEVRLDSTALRRLTTLFVVVIGWLYLVPQLQAAGFVLAVTTGAPSWLGVVLVGLVVTATVTFGGMRSMTFVQSLQFWIKVATLAVPTVVLVAWFLLDRSGPPAPRGDLAAWSRPFPLGGESVLGTYSLVLALALGTMGLPHVLVRFYTNPDGRGARRTTVLVLGMLGAFGLFPVILGVLARFVLTPEAVAGRSDAAVLLLPGAALGGWVGALLAAVVVVGAFAAFLSVCSGLVLTVSGVLSSDLLPGRSSDFRLAAHVAGLVPLVLALVTARLEIAHAVSLAFVVAASSFCPLLVLGIWWRGLTDRGAIAGIAAGGGLATVAAVVTLAIGPRPGWFGTLLAEPAIVTVPLAFAVTLIVSRATAHRVPTGVGRTLLRLHAPERLGLGDLPGRGRPAG